MYFYDLIVYSLTADENNSTSDYPEGEMTTGAGKSLNVDENELTLAENLFFHYAINYTFIAEYEVSIEEKVKYLFGLVSRPNTKRYMNKQRYNDFSFQKIDGKLMAESGRYGSYRPEGYMSDGEAGIESIIKRLEKLIDGYNIRQTEYKARLVRETWEIIVE